MVVHTCTFLDNSSTPIRQSDGTPQLDGAALISLLEALCSLLDALSSRWCSTGRSQVRNSALSGDLLESQRPNCFPVLVLDTTTDRLYDDFIRLLFLHTHREASALSNELAEESD